MKKPIAHTLTNTYATKELYIIYTYTSDSALFCSHDLQWNLRIKDILGAAALSFIQRLSSLCLEAKLHYNHNIGAEKDIHYWEGCPLFGGPFIGVWLTNQVLSLAEICYFLKQTEQYSDFPSINLGEDYPGNNILERNIYPCTYHNYGDLMPAQCHYTSTTVNCMSNKELFILTIKMSVQ